MSASSARPFALSVALVVTLALGCGSDEPPPPRGSPVLTDVYWVAGGVSRLVWTRVPNVRFDPAVPAFVTEIDFVFDRRLDGDGIEDRFTQGGVVMTRPKAMPPVTVTWADKAAQPGTPPGELVVSYNSTARFGGDSSYVFARPLPGGVPSDTLVTFGLDLSSLRSEYGEPASAPTTIPVRTSPFSVSIAAPSRPVVTGFALPLVFSNRVSGAAVAAPFVKVTAAGALVPSKILPDATDRSRLYVAPADCLGVWPAATVLTVTVGSGLTDTFGRALEQGATATFETGARSSTPDASCAVADGGADGSADVPASDAAPDGGTDGPDPADAGVEAAD